MSIEESEKGSVVFKHKPEDFIVEEIAEDGNLCKVSESISAFQATKVDFGKLDVNDRRNFLACDMEKIGIDHINAIGILRSGLGKQSHEIGLAGAKDKLAWTCQRISIFDPHMDKIRDFSADGMILKNFRWIRHKIKTGDLKGNKFRITLRDVDSQAIKILSRLRNTEYLPNLFGLQRFGFRKDNFTIGKFIFKRKFKEAILAYLTGYGEDESEEVKKGKKRLRISKDIARAEEYLPKELITEHRIINYLKSNPKDYIGALQILGEKVLLIICQSVQSQLFNEALMRGMDEKIVTKDSEIALIGYDYENPGTRLSRLEDAVLTENGLEIGDFRVPDMPYLSLASGMRKALFRVQELVVDISEDEEFEHSKKIVLSFSLDSGSYATTLLENFFILR
jgi:tRNA pseudouridine13 synthase